MESNAPKAPVRSGVILQTGDLSDVIIASVLAVALYGGLLWFALTNQGGQDRHILILSGIAAAALGWLIGIIASPYNVREKSAFSELARLVYGFVTGYLISKVDPLITHALDPTSPSGVDPRLVEILLFATASLLVSVVLTYITRSYWISKAVAKPASG